MQTLLILYAGGGLLLAALSIPLIRGKIPPNGLYGFRTPRTMNHPDIWYRANRYAGWRLFWSGLAIVVGALIIALIPGLTLDQYALGVLAVVLIALGLAIGQSLVYLNRLK